MLIFVLAGCALTYEGGSDETGYYGADGGSGSTSTWVEIQVGYCEIERYSLTGGTYGEVLDTVNEDGGGSPQIVYGETGEILEVKCDASIVPQYDDPAVRVDPTSCPKVYCNPHGGTNRTSGESSECGSDLWVYVYPQAYAAEETDTGECGPWNLY
jgi:ribosomal protein S27E